MTEDLKRILTKEELRGIPTSLLLLDVVGCRCSPTCARCVGKLAELDARIPDRLAGDMCRYCGVRVPPNSNCCGTCASNKLNRIYP